MLISLLNGAVVFSKPAMYLEMERWDKKSSPCENSLTRCRIMGYVQGYQAHYL
ncbi:MAG: hypothetical protein ACXAEX_22615 [Promethearchaeota archaeon]